MSGARNARREVRPSAAMMPLSVAAQLEKEGGNLGSDGADIDALTLALERG